MKRTVVVRLVLAAVIVATMVGIGTMAVPSSDPVTSPAARLCAVDADCPGNSICCPITNTCTTSRGCRKDPL